MFLSPGSPATCCRSLRPCEGIKNYFSSTFSWRSEEDKRIKSNVWLNHHFSESAAWPFIPLLQLWITVQPPVDDDTDQYTAKTHVDQRTKHVNLTAVPHFLRHHTSTSNNLSHWKAIGSADSSLDWPPERRLHLAKLPPGAFLSRKMEEGAADENLADIAPPAASASAAITQSNPPFNLRSMRKR